MLSKIRSNCLAIYVYFRTNQITYIYNKKYSYGEQCYQSNKPTRKGHCNPNYMISGVMLWCDKPEDLTDIVYILQAKSKAYLYLVDILVRNNETVIIFLSHYNIVLLII